MAISRITTQGIKDGTITNSDVSATAAIAATKLGGSTFPFYKANGVADNITLVTNNIISVTTDALTSGLGSITAVGHANITPTGVYGTGEITSILIWGNVVPGQTTTWSDAGSSQTPNWKDIAA